MNKKDTCILCGADTPYDITTPIYERFGYIEGAGQACFITQFKDYHSGDFKCPDGIKRRNKKIHLEKI